MGAAFYSHMWKNVGPENNGMHRYSPTGGGFGPDYTVISLVHEKSGRYTKYRDESARAPYLLTGRTSFPTTIPAPYAKSAPM